MEEIINKLIEIDNNAKEQIKIIQEKEENIENYINDRLIKEKEQIDNKYSYKRKKIQEKYDLMYEERKQQLYQEKEKNIIKIKEKYKQEKDIILQDIINSII